MYPMPSISTRSAVDFPVGWGTLGVMSNIASLPEIPDARRRVARAVKAHLSVTGISPSKMASRIGMSQSAMSRRTSALQAFDIDELGGMASELGITVVDLIQMPKDDALDYGGVVSDLNEYRSRAHGRAAALAPVM